MFHLKASWQVDLLIIFIMTLNLFWNALNFSIWVKYTQTQKNEKLKAIYRTAHSSMPLPAYTWAHIEAELSKEDREKIRDWTGVRK